MASKIEAVETTDDAIIVFITHLDSDSFSRSVNRAGNKAWRDQVGSNILRARALQYCSARYAHTDLGGRTCMSTIVYTTSHDHADEVLGKLHGEKV